MFIQETVMMLMFLCMYTCIRKLVWIEKCPLLQDGCKVCTPFISYNILSKFSQIYMKHLSVLVILMVLLYYFSAVIFFLET
jgi:hypothetical protein